MIDEAPGSLSSGGFGVYVHIPFCRHRCDYCAFATWTDRDHLVVDYLAAVREEIARAAGAGMAPASTVFVGGGTPTRVPPEELAAVLRTIPRDADAEVTVECNPDDVDEPMMSVFAEAGVNRVSIGVQSMVGHVLVALGRTHQPSNVARAVAAARRVGITNINLDLIYGSVGESVTDWETTVRAALDLEPPHVSAYGLTVEPGTPLADDTARHPDDDLQATMYEVADELLSAAGLLGYEVSNWARPGYESRHNRLYWAQADYRGFGCAAHSHRAGHRWWNVRTPDRYISLIRAGASAEAAGEDLDADTRRVEGLQLRLRTREGVAADAFPAEDLADMLRHGLLIRRDDRVVLTRAGRLLANEVSMRLR